MGRSTGDTGGCLVRAQSKHDKSKDSQKALSLALKRPITVYHAKQRAIVMGEDHGALSDALEVSFHHFYYSLGEHYNSVVPKAEEYVPSAQPAESAEQC